MPVLQQSADDNCSDAIIKSQWQAYNKALDIINPIHLPGSNCHDLLRGRVIAGVSILPKSPLLTSQGCLKLVSFLVQLPQPSLIFLADTLNRHNVKAFARMKNIRKMPSDEKALAIALKEGDLYYKMLSDAIQQNEKCCQDRKGWVKLLRYDQVEEENEGSMRRQEKISHRHYLDNHVFKETIDQMAMEFLAHRRPQSKNPETRLPNVINYLLSELPLMLTGFQYQGRRYQTVAYPIAASKATFGPGLANSMFYLVRDIHTNQEFASLRDELVSEAGQEAVHGITLLPIEEEDDHGDGVVRVNGRHCLPYFTLDNDDDTMQVDGHQRDH